MWRNGIVAVLVAFIGLATPVIATADPGEWDPTLPKLISAGAPGDPLAGLDDLAEQVLASGVTRIDGDVLVDPRVQFQAAAK